MEKLLENKTILIVGAGGLLGSELVSASLKQGANVIAADINVESMAKRLLSLGIAESQNNLLSYELDITNEESVKYFFAHKIEHIDGAVNSTYPRNSTYGSQFFDVSLSSFNENLALHLGSAFLFTQQCASYFRQYQKPFSLINISSIYGVIAPKFEIYEGTKMTMPVEYAAIKSAIQHINKYVVSYVNDSNFRINSVCPGGILDGQPETFLNKYKQNTFGTGVLEVEKVLSAVLFLVSDQSEYITGQNLIVDDGYTL